VLKLLFILCHWHGLAKLRMHTDETLQVLDDATVSLGRELRAFSTVTCPAFPTRELKREAEHRQRRQRQSQSRAGTTTQGSSQIVSRQSKTFNLQTYKLHALGDYVATIRQYGTTDSYSTQMVKISICVGSSSFLFVYRANESIASGKEGSFGLAARILFVSSLRLKDANYAYGKSVSELMVWIKFQKSFRANLRNTF
jgi:hypothetical protein